MSDKLNCHQCGSEEDVQMRMYDFIGEKPCCTPCWEEHLDELDEEAERDLYNEDDDYSDGCCECDY